MSSIFDKRPKLTEEEKEQQRIAELTTKKPDKSILAAWYGYASWQGLAKSLEKKGVKIMEQHLSESDIGCVFYVRGLPTHLPECLHDWAVAIRDDFAKFKGSR